MDNNNNTESSNTSSATHEKTEGFITRLLTGWGVPGALARIAAGAILGALSALWALTQSGCMFECGRSTAGASWFSHLEIPISQVAEPGK